MLDMNPATVLSREAIMDAVALLRPHLDAAVWLFAIASATILVVLLISRFPQKLNALTRRLQLAMHPSRAAYIKPIPTCRDGTGDSGYAGSETESDSEGGDAFSGELNPNCDSGIEEGIDDENYDLHRAIRLCQEASTPRRAPSSPYGNDFEMYTTFLSETQKKARCRNVRWAQ